MIARILAIVFWILYISDVVINIAKHLADAQYEMDIETGVTIITCLVLAIYMERKAELL